MIGVIATNYSIGFGLSLMAIAYIFCGLIPALFIREKLYEPYVEQPSSSETTNTARKSANY